MLTRTLTLSFITCLMMIACKSEAPKASDTGAEKPAPAQESKSAEAKDKATQEHTEHGHAEAKADAKADTPNVKRVFFVSPANGAKVTSPVKLVFGVEGMGIRKAGEDVKDQSTGHHHIIVDGAGVAKGKPVPKDATHIHYGGGQTETELKLTPGKHTLTMQLADGAHLSYGEELSATIEVEVTK